MTDNFKVRIASEFGRLKPALKKLSQYLEAITLSLLVREDFEHFMSNVKDIDLESDETTGLGDRFVELPRYFQDVSQDISRNLEGLALPESERQTVLHHIRSVEESFQTIKGLIWEWNLPFLLAHYEKMWTTEKDDWWLSPVGEKGYVIVDASDKSRLMDLIIEDDEWWHYVIQRMKEAGNRIVTTKEFLEFTRSSDIPLIAAPFSPDEPDPTESDNTAS